MGRDEEGLRGRRTEMWPLLVIPLAVVERLLVSAGYSGEEVCR